MQGSTSPIGVILAGGQGRRMGRSKPSAELDGRPLIHYPLAALQASLEQVVVVAKRTTQLPTDVHDAAMWIEPDAPQHPLTGILHALEVAGGRPVLVCAADMPFVTAAHVRTLLAAADKLGVMVDRAHPVGPQAVVASHRGALEPLFALYLPGSATRLAPALAATARLRDAVAALGPCLVEFEDPAAFENVNDERDLARAGARLASRT